MPLWFMVFLVGDLILLFLFILEAVQHHHQFHHWPGDCYRNQRLHDPRKNRR